MTSSTITSELLNGLLSPIGTERCQAENYLKSLSAVDRCGSLFHYLVSSSSSSSSSTNNNASAHECLVSVLLRRDILRITDVALLESMVPPLLQKFMIPNASSASTSTNTKTNTNTNTNRNRRQIGFCIAEILATSSLFNNTSAANTLSTILSTISTLAAQGDIESLRLLAELADRAPVEFTTQVVPSLPQLTAAATSHHVQQNNWHGFEVLLNVIVNGAIATTRTTNMGMLTPPAVPSVDPSSFASQLGTSCLQHMLTQRNIVECPHEEMLQKMLQHFMHAATHCPSLLVGPSSSSSSTTTTDSPLFKNVVDVCLHISKNSHHQNRYLNLSALEVLSSLCDIDYVKRQVLGGGEHRVAMRHHLSSEVIHVCAQLITHGVDEDVDAWIEEPTIMEEFDGDDVATYAETLLGSFLRSLGGNSTLPTVLPLIETLLSNSENWKYQRAALCIIECCISVIPLSFLPHQNIAAQAALSMATAASSQSVRVPFQALRLLGTLCENTQIQQDAHVCAQILQSCTALLSSQCTKVATISCMAIVSYCRGSVAPPSEQKEDEEESRRHLVEPYLSEVLAAIVNGPFSVSYSTGNDNQVNVGVVVLQQKAVGAIACLAEAAGAAFVPFYANVMPHLISISQLPCVANHEVAKLVGSALESATIIGQSIGSEHRHYFNPDANTIMQFIVPILQQHNQTTTTTATTDIPMDQLLSACARIATVMGNEYVPFMEIVLTQLLQRVSAPPDVSLTEGNESGLESTNLTGADIDDDAGTESMTVAIPGKGITKITINTSMMQEKLHAIRAIYEHALALRGTDFGPYAEKCLEALVPLIGFQFSSEIRSVSAQTCATVFDSLCAYYDDHQQGVTIQQKYFSILCKSVAKQIYNEDSNEGDENNNNTTSADGDKEDLYALADALSEVKYIIYNRVSAANNNYDCRTFQALYSLVDARNNVNICMKAIASCLQRRNTITTILSEKNGLLLTGDDERQEYQNNLKEEEKLLTPLVDSVGYTLKLFKADFIPIFETEVCSILGPHVLCQIDDDRAQLSAICLYDDVVEHCGPAAATKYAPYLIEGILSVLRKNQQQQNRSEGEDTVLQASIYGIAQIARYGPNEVLVPHGAMICNYLIGLVQGKAKEEAENAMLFEHTVSALASLLLIGRAPLASSSGGINQENLFDIFLDNLPLLEDDDEAKICHDGLCDVIERMMTGGGIMNQGEVRLGKIMKAIGEIFHYASEEGGEEDIMLPVTSTRLVHILRQLQQDIPGPRMNTIFSSLEEQTKHAIHTVVS